MRISARCRASIASANCPISSAERKRISSRVDFGRGMRRAGLRAIMRAFSALENACHHPIGVPDGPGSDPPGDQLRDPLLDVGPLDPAQRRLGEPRQDVQPQQALVRHLSRRFEMHGGGQPLRGEVAEAHLGPCRIGPVAGVLGGLDPREESPRLSLGPETLGALPPIGSRYIAS